MVPKLSTLFWIFSSLCLLKIYCQDPCNSYLSIQGEEKRSPDYIFNYMTDTAISDDRLNAGWYRILNNNGENMPTSAPGTFRCGTFYPIWLNGQLPINEEEVTRQACVETTSDECQEKWDIRIKRCAAGYLVYELKTSTIQSSAYCFGRSPECQNGTSSETGFEPCKTDFPSISFTPEVIQIGMTAESGNLDPVLKCNFNDNGIGYLYDVYWYVRDETVKRFHNVGNSSIDNTNLQPKDWIKSYPVNETVTCSVRARYDVGTTPGYKYYSPAFTVIVKETLTTTKRTTNSQDRSETTISRDVPSSTKIKSKSNMVVILVIVLSCIVVGIIVVVVVLIVIKKRKSRITVDKEAAYVKFGKKDEVHAYDSFRKGVPKGNTNTSSGIDSSDCHDYATVQHIDLSNSNVNGYSDFVVSNDNHAYDRIKTSENQLSNDKTNPNDPMEKEIDQYDFISPEVICSIGHVYEKSRKTDSIHAYASTKTPETIDKGDNKPNINDSTTNNTYDIIS